MSNKIVGSSTKLLMAYASFNGGLNTEMSDDDMPINCLSRADNATFLNGRVKTRPPFELFATLSLKPMDMYYHMSDLYGDFFLIETYDIAKSKYDLYKMDPDTYALTIIKEDVTIQDALTFWSPTGQCEIFIFTDTNGTMYKYDGTTCVTLGATAPKARYLAIHGSRLFAANGEVTKHNYVYISNTGDPETWDVNNALNISNWEGDSIQNIIEYQGKCYVFLQQSIYAITGYTLTDYTFYSVINNIGLLCPQAICNSGSEIIFIGSNSKVYSFNGVNLTDLSTSRIQYYLNDIDIRYNIECISMVNTGDKVYILLPMSGDEFVILAYDLLIQAWSVWPLVIAPDVNGDIKATSLITIKNEYGFNELYISCWDSKIYKLMDGDSTSRDEMVTPAAYTPVTLNFKPFMYDHGTVRFKIKSLFIKGTSTQPVTVTYWTDEDDDANIPYETYTFTPQDDLDTMVIPGINKRGRKFFVKITGSRDLKVDNVSIYIKTRKPGV